MEGKSDRSPPLSTGIVREIDDDRGQMIASIGLSEVNQRHASTRQPSSGWST